MKVHSRDIIEKWAKEKLKTVDAGHDWWHIKRVLVNAKKIHQVEGGDWAIIELAVLLHDVPDPKFFDEEKMMTEIEQVLLDDQVPGFVIQQVLNIIRHLSFSKSWSGMQFDSPEFRIVQDADRLDAIGAIGIARAFSYGGHKGRDFYDPDVKPQEYTNADEYRKSKSTTINHFYEKLLLLHSQMKTQTGKELAQERHEYMKGFLKQFYDEIGESL